MGQQGYPYPPPYGAQGYPPAQGQGHGQGYGPQGYPPHGGYGQGEYQQGGYAPQGPPRRSPKLVLGIVGAVVAFLSLLAVIIYFGFFHYTKVAAQHVPAGATLVVKIDLVEVATYGPVRRNLVPLLDEAPAGAAAAAASGKRSARIADEAGFSPTRDIRELVVCFVGDPDHYALIVGGRFPPGKLIPALGKVAAAESSTEWAQAGDYLKAKNAAYVVGQASDGTAIFASDEPTLRAALPAGSEHTRLGLPEEGAVTYAGAPDAWKKISASPYASMLGSLQNLGNLGAFNGTMTIGNNPKMVTQVSVAGNPEDGKATLYRVFTDLRRISELRRKLTGAGNDYAGEEQALGGSVIETKGPSLLKVTTPLTYDGVDRGAQSLAQHFRTARSNLGKPVQPPGMMLPGGFQLPIPIPGLQLPSLGGLLARRGRQRRGDRGAARGAAFSCLGVAVLATTGVAAQSPPPGATDPEGATGVFSDMERIVSVEETTYDWFIDEEHLTRTLPVALRTLCLASPAARREAQAIAHGEVEKKGDPAALFVVRRKKTSEVERALHASRVAALLDRAVANEGSCPFWALPEHGFVGRQRDIQRVSINVESGGVVQVRQSAGERSFGGGGGLRALAGFGATRTVKVLAGLELTGGALFRASDSTKFAIALVPALPFVLRINDGSVHYDIEATPVAYFTSEDSQVSYGVRGGFGVGISVLRTRSVIPWAGPAIAYERFFPSGGREAANVLKGGLRVGIVWDPFID